jgi:capsular exopolysaccharide synthesis family protein
MQSTEKNNERSLISQLWFMYYPYWPVLILLFLLCGGGAWFYLRYATPMYESTASILIKDEKKGLDDSKMLEALNMLSTKKIIENEIEVIKSRTLMDEVVKNLHLYASVYEEGKMKQVPLYSRSPIIIQALHPDSLIEAEKVYFRINRNNSNIIFGNKSYPLNRFVKTNYGTLQFTLNAQVKIINKNPQYFSLENPQRVSVQLLKKLEASSVSKLSSVIYLRLKDEVPKRSKDILNELITAYYMAAIKEKNTLAANTLAFVEERLNVVAHDLDSIEQKLQQYKSKKGATDISSQGKLFLENVNTNDRRLADISNQMAVLNQVEKYILSKDKKGGIVPSTLGVSDPLLTQLLDKLYDSELQYEKLKKTTAENNPILIAVTDQIEKIKPNILENIKSQKKGLEASRNDLHITKSMYSSALQKIPQKERELVDISREQTIKNNIYTFLLQKREEAILSHSSMVADSRVIDRAESSIKPVSPSKKLTFLISIIAAFILFIGIITGKDLFNRTILYRNEIEAATRFPIIGEISYQKTKNPIVTGDGKRTVIAEQFRKLRASLNFIEASAKKRRIIVTSTISGEGKSFITANLGVSLALAGKKVVLLEIDLINPSLSEKLNISANKGVSDYLLGACEHFEIIKRTEAHENLFIIPSGPLPDNPSELLANGKVKDLLMYLNEIFDYIIIDTAPVGYLSDAYVLSPLCDITFYIVRHKHTPKVVVQRLEESNKINELKNIFLIFNGVQSRGFSKNDYEYGYGYGNGYGYKYKKAKRIAKI